MPDIFLSQFYHNSIFSPEYEPRLFDADGDLSKRWYIDYRIWDTDKQAFVRKQYMGMNKYNTLRDRRRVCKQKLAAGERLHGQRDTFTMRLDPEKASIQQAMSWARQSGILKI
ncbi:hypothetical protein [Hymenobacter sp. AT01-02]|uniref:hypothetical protein n=1 Tax=Hymenobacter sp. AT01-02 TaxID=1571877 RepID=UPI00128F83B6|nr:hypothetical protein [Hymenobacter sp. AT01-02]